MTELGQNLFSALVLSGIYVLIGLGITVVFGLTRLINFAHGQVLVIGAFVAFTVTSRGLPFWAGLLAATVVASVLALILERAVFRFTLTNPLNGLIVGLGVLLVLQVLTAKAWGTLPIAVRSPFDGAWIVFGTRLSFNRIGAIAIAAVGAALFLIFLRWTDVGRRVQAAQENPLAAAHVGINVGRVITLAFVVGSGAAGAAGAVLGTLFALDAYQGGAVVLKGFAVALLGGLGNVPGVIVGSLIYGFGETFLAAYTDPTWVPVFTFGIIIVILLVRPGGLMGMPTSEGSQFGERLRFERQPRPGLPPAVRAGLILAALVLPVVAFHLLPSQRLQALFVLIAIYAIPAYSLSLLYHYTGMLSIAQAGFMAVGAYASAILVTRFGWSFWASLLPAIALSALAGAVIGLPVARARGHYFVFVTFAFGSLVVVLINNLSWLTGGDSGLFLTGPPIAIGSLSLGSLSTMFYLAFGFTVLAALLVYAIRRSPFGMRLASIRDNERLALSLGLNVKRHKVIAFAISGGIAGLGGVLFVQEYRIIVPDSFSVFSSIQIIVAMLLGGASVLGPAVGTLVLLLIPEPLGLGSADKDLGYGALLIVVMLLFERGVVPSITTMFSHLAQRLQWWTPISMEKRNRGAAAASTAGDEVLSRQVLPGPKELHP